MSANVAQKTKLVAIEDHRMIREMLVSLLSTQKDIDVVGAAGSLSDAEGLVTRENPNIVLLDIALPDGSGIEWACSHKQNNPDTKIIFLTAHDDEATALAAIKAGAEGYLVKNSSCDRLIDTIKSVASGDYVFDTSITASIIKHFANLYPAAQNSNDKKYYGLSIREREIVSLVAQGKTNKEIAQEAYVSVNTVKTHLRRIYQRLGITSRRELMQNQYRPNQMLQ